MRIRTADVNVKLAAGLKTVFEHAVERNVAWVLGEGHQYADLEKVGKRHGYVVGVILNEDDEPGYWVAVRGDLIRGGINYTPEDEIKFDTVRSDLGEVVVSREGVTFEGDDRNKSNLKGAAIDTPEYEYFDQVLTVTALKD